MFAEEQAIDLLRLGLNIEDGQVWIYSGDSPADCGHDGSGLENSAQFEGSPYSLNNAGSVVPLPPSTPGLTGYRKGVTARCPGAAAQPAPDKSNPFKTADVHCKPEDAPK